MQNRGPATPSHEENCQKQELDTTFALIAHLVRKLWTNHLQVAAILDLATMMTRSVLVRAQVP